MCTSVPSKTPCYNISRIRVNTASFKHLCVAEHRRGQACNLEGRFLRLLESCVPLRPTKPASIDCPFRRVYLESRREAAEMNDGKLDWVRVNSTAQPRLDNMMLFRCLSAVFKCPFNFTPSVPNATTSCSPGNKRELSRRTKAPVAQKRGVSGV